MKSWYAVYTQPRNEERAYEHLARQSFDVLLPRYLKRTSHARRVSMVPAPLFPRYLFVSFDSEEQRWRAIRSTRGVIDLVGNCNGPVRVPESVINEIERRRDEDGFVVLARHADLQRGTRVRIECGPFANVEAIFQTHRDEGRILALLSLMGREVLVQLPIRSVTPL